MTTPDPTLAARLAPCPFCGGEASYRTAFGVKCNGCQAGLPCFHHAAIVAWNTRTNQLITTAEADARVKAAVLAEMEAAKSMVWTLGHEIKASMLVDEDNEQAVLDMVKATAAAIRARGVTG